MIKDPRTNCYPNSINTCFQHNAHWVQAISLTVAMLLAALLSLSTARPVFAQSGVISGVVTDTSSNPIEDVTVELYKETFMPIFGLFWSSVGYSNTLANGTFAFSELDAGKYRLFMYDSVSPSRYKSEYYNDAAYLDSATIITLAENQTRRDINVQLAKLGSISGRVTIANGDPLPNAQIEAYVFASCCGYWATAGLFYADLNGDYVVTGLEPNTYRLGFKENTFPSAYQQEYHLNAADVESATDIAVGDGQEVTGIDAQLDKLGTVSGRVTDTNGAPISNVRVELYRFESCCDYWAPVHSVYTDDNGDYVTLGVSAGTFRAGFFDDNFPAAYVSEFYANAERIESATDIAVASGQDVFGIDAQLARLGSISGRATDANGDAIANLFVSIYTGDTFMNNVTTDGNGEYLFGGLAAGIYKIGFDGSNFFPGFSSGYQPEFYDDASTLLAAAEIAVAQGQDVTGIDAQLAKLGSISGRVTDESGNPLSSIQVLIYAASEVGCCSPATAQTDENGLYSVTQLPAASYRVEFSDSFTGLYQTEYYSHALTFETASLVEVVISEDVTNINAQLTKLGTMSGKVTNEAGDPLANINVALYAENMDPCCIGSWYGLNTNYSDSDGRYAFGGLPAGKYRLHFGDYSSPPLYQHEYYNNALTLQMATDIILNRSQELVLGDVQLAKPANITGRITVPEGNFAELWCATLNHFSPLSNQWEELESACVNENGEYGFYSVPVGIVRVGFREINAFSAHYRAEFYNNAFTIEEADDIVVTSGQIIANINALLDRRTHVSGRVTDGVRKALQNVSVGVYKRGADTPNGGQTWELVTSDTTNDNGDYTIYDLPVGAYRVGFSNGNALYKTEYFNNVYYVQNAQDVVITEGGVVDNVNAQLEGITLNVPPLAMQDAMTVHEGGTIGTLITSAASVLDNDEDADADALSAVLVTSPTRGTLTLNANGTFRYTHDGSETTSDAFTYRASDGVNSSTIISVTITITPVNDAPIAVSDAMTVTRGGSATQLNNGTSVLANDSDAESRSLTAALASQPQHGSITLNADGTFIYVHDGSDSTSDSFTYKASDGQIQSSATTVSIRVIGSNMPQPKQYFSYLPLGYR